MDRQLPRKSTMRKLGNKNLKIVAACSVAIFSLLAGIGGVFAWFVVSMKQTAQDMDFAVINVGSCDLYSIDLIKFDYRVVTQGEGESAYTYIDYLNPETGTVNDYEYSKVHESFGYEEEGTWHSVEMMNTYDPVSLLLYGGEVKDLNCNSIYKFVVSSTDLNKVKFDAFVAKLAEREKEEDELFLTTCVDFDIYFEEDLLDTNPLFIDGDDTKLYYPSYIDKSETLSEQEETYYKISYLSYLESSHEHFYDGSSDEIALSDELSKQFVHDSETGLNFFTFYVNVNYAPSELEDTMTLIYQ